MKKRAKIRYGVVGLGHIAQVAVLPAFKRSKNSELVALVSGDREKLRTLSKRYKIDQAYSYDDYDQLLESEAIDAVYIALPNSMHEEYAIRAARAGIHVLCEKPLAVTSRACERIIRTAKNERITLMVAYRLHFDPVNMEAVRIANSGKIGDPHYIASQFGYELRENNIRAIPEEGGSPLHDIGIYCINASRYLFQSEPEEAFAFAVSPQRHLSRIIQTVSATLKFPGERVASFTCSFGSAAISNFRIVGTKGDLFVDNAYEYVGESEVRLTIDEKKHVWRSKPGDQFAAELDYFSSCLLTGKQPEPSGETALADVRIIEALLKSIETGKAISLKGSLPKITRRPGPAQEIRKRSHREPHLVKVQAASK